jgi:hypothetical protein
MMTDHDQLLARADEFRRKFYPDHVQTLVAELAAALRAALAAQPEPLFEGTRGELRQWLAGSRGNNIAQLVGRMTVLPAAAGSATPEEPD